MYNQTTMSDQKERFTLIPAVYLVLRKGSEVLLLRRANTGYQDGNYGLVSGHSEGGETAKSAMIREAKEEAGITIGSKHLSFVHVAHRLRQTEPSQERIDIFFETTQWDGEIINVEPEKCDDLSWFPIDDLPTNTIPFVRRVLSDITNSVSYSEYVTEPEE